MFCCQSCLNPSDFCYLSSYPPSLSALLDPLFNRSRTISLTTAISHTIYASDLSLAPFSNCNSATNSTAVHAQKPKVLHASGRRPRLRPRSREIMFSFTMVQRCGGNSLLPRIENFFWMVSWLRRKEEKIVEAKGGRKK